MTFPFLLASLLVLQAQLRDPALAAQIPQLLHTVLTTDDDRQEEAAKAEAKRIFQKRGLPTIDDVGDEASYEFVVLTCSSGPADFQAKILLNAKRALSRHALAADAVLYCEARVRHEQVKAQVKRHPPTHPALRDELQRLLTTDQAVRRSKDDAAKIEQVDREHEAPLRAIFERHGVPTYRMVGVEAASSFVIMIQHQSPDFRRQVLPKLKANVEAGQADSTNYAMMYDRSSHDAGGKQRYGENLECNNENPTLHETPIEDEEHVNERRAQVGLIRVELYARTVVELSPVVCRAGAIVKGVAYVANSAVQPL